VGGKLFLFPLIESGVLSRESGVGSRESGVWSQESGIASSFKALNSVGLKPYAIELIY
jgi:hypothetical protein